MRIRAYSAKQRLKWVSCVCLLYGGLPHSGLTAGIPVIDVANLQQSVVSASENVAQTLKQIEQYRTQLQQYENMLQNTAAPTAYVWDQATTMMGKLRNTVDTLNFYKSQAGGLDAYLEKFQDVSYYRSAPCFNRGCSQAEWEALNHSSNLVSSQAQKRANDALIRGLAQQHDALEADARQLQRLQQNAQSARGQMQAISYANQLASQQANQLLQIRAMLSAQQNALATRNQILADREARQIVADDQYTKGIFIPSQVRDW
jgi:P-type conjugative transfer protein TrbJ